MTWNNNNDNEKTEIHIYWKKEQRSPVKVQLTDNSVIVTLGTSNFLACTMELVFKPLTLNATHRIWTSNLRYGKIIDLATKQHTIAGTIK